MYIEQSNGLIKKLKTVTCIVMPFLSRIVWLDF